MAEEILFGDSIGENEYGFIIDGSTGRLKGIWVPSANENDPLPTVIISLMNNCFGVSPEDSETIH